MNTVTESIYNDGRNIIPMAEVSHIDKLPKPCKEYVVYFKHTKWNKEGDCYDPVLYLDIEKGEKFVSAWCKYRGELEADTLKNICPDS